ncbi:LacI family transcriptional regulator [Labedella gwakjiensis]|uniref:LacI family transcriptional regulator n=1 Tax=Labedella gwakjiensis TaxID=390269 RepID=A0A2P8GU85_9MICO|nr:LacI family DNA-binding transcriptional regulator [Labedella gwakjiensis]PSL37532.1 LacI family transcriptional regulator [Labedella gwakjiensis]RUQ84832.1 LacI family transcriptional regulator [Labedella gwakjiensis]
MHVRPRLADVAARAGVSEKTVSNLLNGYPYISATTRQKVESAISDLGYRPNLSARSMGRGRTGFIALAVPSLSNPHFAELAGRVIEAAKRHHWTVLIEETGGRKASEDTVVSTMPYLVDGIILHPESLTDDDVEDRARDTPIVLFGERGLELVADRVVADNVSAADEITQHLIDTGHRRIATVGIRSDAHLQASQFRDEGFRLALSRNGIPFEDDLVIDVPDYSRAAGAGAAHILAAMEPRPDAVLCFNTAVAAGVLSGLYALGIRVPDQIGVAAFDDIDEAEFTAPPLTTIAWDVGGMAEEAVRLLAERYDSRDLPTRDVTLQHTLKTRASSTPRL